MKLDPEKYPNLSRALKAYDYLDRLHLSQVSAEIKQEQRPPLNEIEVVVNSNAGKQTSVSGGLFKS